MRIFSFFLIPGDPRLACFQSPKIVSKDNGLGGSATDHLAA